jgi:hypothetical protein
MTGLDRAVVETGLDRAVVETEMDRAEVGPGTVQAAMMIEVVVANAPRIEVAVLVETVVVDVGLISVASNEERSHDMMTEVVEVATKAAAVVVDSLSLVESIEVRVEMSDAVTNAVAKTGHAVQSAEVTDHDQSAVAVIVVEEMTEAAVVNHNVKQFAEPVVQNRRKKSGTKPQRETRKGPSVSEDESFSDFSFD